MHAELKEDIRLLKHPPCTAVEKNDCDQQTNDSTNDNTLLDNDDESAQKISLTLENEHHALDEDLDDTNGLENYLSLFYERYSSLGANLFLGTLDTALANSLYSTNNPCPLVIYLHNDTSGRSKVFCSQILCSELILNYLANYCIFWACDLATNTNYEESITLFETHFGLLISQKIQSMTLDHYPLLLCLTFQYGQVQILDIIQGSSSEEEVLTILVQARESFEERYEVRVDTRFLYDDCCKNMLNDRASEDQSFEFKQFTCKMPDNWSQTETNADFRFQVTPDSTEYISVERKFNETLTSNYYSLYSTKRTRSHNLKIIRLERIQNLLWFDKYMTVKNEFDRRLIKETEKCLYHGCSQGAAHTIIEQCFDANLIGKHGTALLPTGRENLEVDLLCTEQLAKYFLQHPEIL
ncbi:unnamed protein product [Didymodactylos carnosus]|uniref:UAS domain-containing protein n=1 Tax=Didymodactylos carnosus TaxID=1234261 RepID=A0A814LDT3_9BILA|nr:unnamed protein product [Didymodactylos carnosus]CAF1063337.1 unnamed protein product [Didymodactylos carnosus]CAF3677291.1 unnamed protein product [Didymodactylos carnosus]CAF3831382.1 unnamed protein product [Didymodactylos carnosus]